MSISGAPLDGFAEILEQKVPHLKSLLAEAWQRGYDAGEDCILTAEDPDHECHRNPYEDAP